MSIFTLQQKHRHMIYQDYFRNSDFEDIWVILNGFYLEHEDIKPMYASLVDEIKALPIEEKYSDSTIQMCLDSYNEIMVKGAPDPQVWLVGREVKIDFSSWKDNIDEETINDSPGIKTFNMLSGKEKRELARQSDSKSIDGTLIKRHIENQTWFYSEWKQDPTVYGMLTMLFGNNQNDSSDNIFDIFGHDKETLTKYWKLLTSNNIEQSPIMFNHTIIGSEELPLSDVLYIKMNARGKPLTNFENFKAEVIKWVSENVSKEESIRVASKFDNEWTDIFWENGLGKSVHNVEELFFVFFNRIYYQYVVTERNSEEFVLSEKNSDKNSEYRLFSGSKNKHEKNSGDKFVTFQSLEPYTSRLKKVLTSLETIFQGIRQIDLSTLQPYWKKDFYFIPRYILDKDIPKQLTDEILDFTTINQQERVAFYAICKYFLSPSHDDDEKESLSHWMRFVWNLISDKDSGGADTIRSVSAIQQAVALIDMIENPRRVYGELYEKSSEYRQKLKNNTVLEHRFIEEIEKVIQILHPDCNVMLPSWAKDWEQAIIEAEKFRLFTGSIGALIYDGAGKIDWSNFEAKYNNVKKYFANPDNPSAIRDMIPYFRDEDILELFSDYTLNYKDSNVGHMLRSFPTRFHKYLLAGQKSALLTRLQSDIETLCANNPNFWINKNWVNGHHVLSNYSKRSGAYDLSSYFIGTDCIDTRYDILSDSDAIPDGYELIVKNKQVTKPYKGLQTEFYCRYKEKKYKFIWTAYDWVDMYDGDANLWERGLHTRFNGDKEPHFHNAITLWKEIVRCIRKFDNPTDDSI